MFFPLSKLAWLVLEPGNLLLLLLGAGVGLLFRRFRKIGRGLLVAVAAAALAVAVLPVGPWLLAPLESRFPPPPQMPARVDGVIALGGGLDAASSAARGRPVATEHVERLVAFAALARRYPQARLVYAGGSGDLMTPAYREADAARLFLEELGVDPARVIFERDSRNTIENAAKAKNLVRPEAGELWLLVTSAWHMPRAMGVFRAQGWPVVAYPVGYLTGGRAVLVRPDLTRGLALLGLAAREWIGLAVYRIAGHVDALFPAPPP